MARGLIAASPHIIKSNPIFTSIFRARLLENFPLQLCSSLVPAILLQRFSWPPTRFLCSCSYQQDAVAEMTRYKEAFARRMDMAGLKPHHRLAIGVSGGPDSMALCILASMWKKDGHCAVATEESDEFVDGLVGIVIDHGLRPESKDEANLVCNRVRNMGVRCEIAPCEWSEGRPKPGHLQEAARDKRYQLLRDICIKHKTGVLLIAHHADDQAELFILRLSRSSGVLGLSGMAFVSQLYPTHTYHSSELLSWPGILLVRPLLDFSKEDMYQICLGANQEWVEDPTNQSSLFARNRIRMGLNNLSSSIFRAELLAVISACRRTRVHVDQVCTKLINEAVNIMPEGYAVINVGILDPGYVDDIILSKFLTLILQFISQRHKPVRGSASKLLMDYIRSSPCKTCVTAAGCYLCPSPGSKGSKVLVCCSVDSSALLKMEVLQALYNDIHPSISTEVEQIVENAKSSSESFISGDTDDRLLGLTSSQFRGRSFSECVITEAKRLGILSSSTFDTIVSLQNQESEYFKPTTEAIYDHGLNDEGESVRVSSRRNIYPGQVCYFMNRFLIRWNPCIKIPSLSSSSENVSEYVIGKQKPCTYCIVDHNKGAEVRSMVDSDWLYLAHLSKSENEESSTEHLLSDAAKQQGKQKIKPWSEFVKLSANKALLSLKSIPVAARRSLPVLVDSRGLLLSIPSVHFQHCPCLAVSAEFKPRVPICGGHSSFL
ncbi:OLC1v1037312C1 [Oldenlandia corymbosa var. corymbosa]|uniref:tRNA(Ile)-lysidine synthetase n=1 Tax=Oldenlandia corymbosa var. corymbosa TaxID=529605 RepID=A0AAV1D0L5_OLDCO|nr:OLC1v1037312C1 [Oldenlandia corymbosa var. corymbosa]